MTKAAKQAVKAIQERSNQFKPDIGIILGSGLGGVAEALEDVIILPYEEIPGMPPCGVVGHGGQLFLGQLHGIKVAALQGRAHFYEGHDNDTAKTLVRVLKLLGCQQLFITNAAGSMQKAIQPGSLVLISDHINFQFRNPLVGPNDEEFGPRFIGLEDAYNPKLREQMHTIAKDKKINLYDGVYVGVLGPSFETPTEIKAFVSLGGDVVGMSTISEVITAAHCGLETCVISAVSNMAAGMSPEKISHEVTLKGAKKTAQDLQVLILGFIEQYAKQSVKL